jgi:hypothetical protein
VLFRQFIPRQICVQKQDRDSSVATMGTIVVYFDAPHGATNDKVLYLSPDWEKLFGRLVEVLPTERTGYPDDALRTNSSRVHHPENPEFLGATDTLGDKLIGHEALPLPGFR